MGISLGDFKRHMDTLCDSPLKSTKCSGLKHDVGPRELLSGHATDPHSLLPPLAPTALHDFVLSYVSNERLES